jgi:DNA-binding winged helix-turn-helix (wHTH) protein
MDKQNLIIFKQDALYKIIKELEENLNFNIFNISAENDLEDKLENLGNYLIITQKKLNGRSNQFLFSKTPLKLSKLIEKINIQFLKQQFIEKSEISVGKYHLDLNSRELILKNKVLKLTEKESSIIIYLNKINDVVDIAQLQSQVWGHHSKLETHTVETHIYRLRKKVLKTFEDNNFIRSKKNGYQISQT